MGSHDRPWWKWSSNRHPMSWLVLYHEWTMIVTYALCLRNSHVRAPGHCTADIAVYPAGNSPLLPVTRTATAIATVTAFMAWIALQKC